MFKSIICELKERIEKECGWISVKERSPSPGEDVICYDREYDNTVVAYYDIDEGWMNPEFYF